MLQAKGLVVIGEVRRPTKFPVYTSVTSDQVNRLLDAGVPSANITVAGHSKGGVLSLIISIGLGRDDIKFAVLAACGSKRPYRVFVMRRAKGLRGKFLIMWDKNDHAFGACDESLRKGRVTFTNKILDDGGGHELFNQPAQVWIDPLVSFAKGELENSTKDLTGKKPDKEVANPANPADSAAAPKSPQAQLKTLTELYNDGGLTKEKYDELTDPLLRKLGIK